jgi:hypothetical protein
MADPLLLEVLTEVRALRREVAELRAERERPAASLRAADRDALRKILPVLAAVYGQGRFAAWEAVDAANLPGVAGANLRLVLDGRDARALGLLLARGAGADVGVGVTVHRDGRDGDGARWRCRGVTPLSWRPEDDAARLGAPIPTRPSR